MTERCCPIERQQSVSRRPAHSRGKLDDFRGDKATHPISRVAREMKQGAGRIKRLVGCIAPRWIDPHPLVESLEKPVR
jgi:hypothetical protein